MAQRAYAANLLPRATAKVTGSRKIVTVLKMEAALSKNMSSQLWLTMEVINANLQQDRSGNARIVPVMCLP
jgi:hypothetical protein